MLDRLFEPREWELLWPFYIHRFLIGVFAVSLPFIVIYYQARGYSFAQVSILWTVMAFANIFFEVPTGIVADVFGRKISVVLGFLLESVPWFLIPFTRSYAELAAVCIFIAIGQTLVSGALDAWVYDELKHRGKQALIREYYTKNGVFMAAGFVVGPLLGALIVSVAPLDWTFFVEGAAGVLLSLFLAVATREHFKRCSVGFFSHLRAMLGNVRVGFRFLSSHGQFGLFLLASAALSGFWSVEELVRPPLLAGLGMPAPLLGVFFSVGGFASAFAPFIGNWLILRAGERVTFIAMTVIAGLSAVAIRFVPEGGFLSGAVLLLVMWVAMYSKYPAIRAHAQHLVPSSQRATILSSFSLGQNIMAAIVLVGGGFLTDVIGPRNAMVLSAVLLVPALGAFFFVRDMRA